VRGYSAGVTSGVAFAQWCQRWMQLGELTGAEDMNAGIQDVLALCEEPVPGRWWRGQDVRLRDPHRRYQRGNAGPGQKRRGEHALEYDVLAPDPVQAATDCLGSPLVDGVNAVPLARDEGGGRSGNVEADMLLLVGGGSSYRLLLIEAKVSGNAWFAVVENLRQLRLYRESPVAQKIFHVRRPGLDLEHPLPVSSVVLAPPSYYAARGRSAAALGPARELARRAGELWATDVQLAVWHTAERAIRPA
jgi:hypothetical protein